MPAKKTSTTKTPKNAKPAGRSLQPSTYTEVGRLHRSALSGGRGSVVITAARNGEGVSLLCHIMALRAAESGQKTLLVDLNMKNTFLSESLGMPRGIWGLAEWREGESLAGVVQPVPGVENLFLLSAPRDEDSVRFLRDVGRASAFFRTLEQEFDQVIVDTTPIGQLNRLNADPALLAAAATRTLLVVMAGVTPRSQVKKALRLLNDTGAQVDGIILNDRKNPSIHDEMLGLVNRLSPMAPGFATWLKFKIAALRPGS